MLSLAYLSDLKNDYSSKQSFGVQSINASGWNAVTATVTGNGSNSSGKTADMRIQVPSEICIVRCSMYVEPMGRNVIFYYKKALEQLQSLLYGK